MKINIIAKPRSKKAYIKRIDAVHYVVAVKEPPVEGKANEAIIRALSKYFNKSSSQIFIVSGRTSKQKIIEIPITLDELEKIKETEGVQLKI